MTAGLQIHLKRLKVAREMGRMLADDGELVERCPMCNGKGELKGELCWACRGIGVQRKGW